MERGQQNRNRQEILRHSTSHLMAQAVKRLFPQAKLGIGPPIKDGFYYDFDIEGTVLSQNLAQIEEEMRKIKKEDLPFRKKMVSKAEAEEIFKKKNEPYKLELLADIEEEKVSLYQQGEFVDLCRGPHVESTGKIGPFKLTRIAGAYWRGWERNKMLQRIYGLAFETEEELDKHLKMVEETRKRDHRKVGRELDFFSFHEEGPGFTFWHPRGMIIFNELVKFWREEHQKRGYQETRCPNLLNIKLWKQSGHFDHYKDHMYFIKTKEGEFALRPMDCPGAILIYQSHLRSYRNLPLRLSELGVIARRELSGTLAGLFRVREATQDDAHIFLKEEQVQEEIGRVIGIVDYFYSVFKLPYRVILSTRPDDAMGDKNWWDKAEEALKNAIKARNLDYQLDPGGGAFYGPKIDFHVQDCLERSWQCATIQLDFFMPQKFDLAYIGKDGKKHRPVMIHRVIMGSIERFMGILIEHYGGAFPIWLSPVQVKILTITDQEIPFAREVHSQMIAEGIRSEIDMENKMVGQKIREAQLEKIPYMIIIGSKEVEKKVLTIRKRSGENLKDMRVENFVEMIKAKIENKEDME